MMRSLYSGVSGLRVHQTKMDVIGNNIANVNTVGFKASSVNFSDYLYQNTKSASGANATTGKAGENGMQIGLGANLASITTNITGAGGSQRTDVWSDLMINGDNFFIINQGGTNCFTKAGAFFVDGAGNLAMKSGGGKVMGWQPDPENPNEIRKDVVSPLTLMSPDKMIAEPSATTDLNVSGNVDPKDSQLQPGKDGVPIQFQFYDSLGNPYTAKVVLSNPGGSTVAPKSYTSYQANLENISDGDGKSIFTKWDEGTKKYVMKTPATVNFGGVTYTARLDPKDGGTTGNVILDPPGRTATTPDVDPTVTPRVFYDAGTGKYEGITAVGGVKPGEAAAAPGTLKTFEFQLVAGLIAGDPVKTMQVDFTGTTQMGSSSQKSALTPNRGAVGTGLGAGNRLGELSGFDIGNDGRIFAAYDNGDTKLLGQIAVASFANPSGLEALGNSLFGVTQNSGDFDGIGKDPTQGGAGNGLTPSVLEMSNVDLSGQFTDMITTQRGFQANSRIITTSDTMLEELINLKR